MSRALVLGGGGPVGIAWESGLIAGLAQAGIDLAEADHIVGTSAGSFVGALLALGHAPDVLAAPYAKLALTPAELEPRSGLIKSTPEDFIYLGKKMHEAFSGERPGQEVRAELAEWALRANTITEREFIDSFGPFLRALPEDEWPEHSYACTAVDTTNGDFVVWDRASGVSLARAVASSCAVPGVFPPVTIKGRRYMDGGMRSMTNADLARGYERVLVLALVAGPIESPLAQRYLAPLQREVAALRETGVDVAVVTPDPHCLDAFGSNLLDFRRSGAAAAAGTRQAQAEATRLREFWT
jgi:NTE family protein